MELRSFIRRPLSSMTRTSLPVELMTSPLEDELPQMTASPGRNGASSAGTSSSTTFRSSSSFFRSTSFMKSLALWIFSVVSFPVRISAMRFSSVFLDSLR